MSTLLPWNITQNVWSIDAVLLNCSFKIGLQITIYQSMKHYLQNDSNIDHHTRTTATQSHITQNQFIKEIH